MFQQGMLLMGGGSGGCVGWGWCVQKKGLKKAKGKKSWGREPQKGRFLTGWLAHFTDE